MQNATLNNRKATLSLEVIVTAAIVLLVLVIITIVFAAKMFDWNSGLKYCDTVCTEKSEDCIKAGYTIPVLITSCEDNQGHAFKKAAYCCREKSK